MVVVFQVMVEQVLDMEEVITVTAVAAAAAAIVNTAAMVHKALQDPLGHRAEAAVAVEMAAYQLTSNNHGCGQY